MPDDFQNYQISNTCYMSNLHNIEGNLAEIVDESDKLDRSVENSESTNARKEKELEDHIKIMQSPVT